MDTEIARHHMIQQQLRTCERMSPATIELLYADRRERYVPAAWRAFAHADFAIPLSPSTAMLTPKLETRLIEEARLKRDAVVLQIGTGSGHLAALLAEEAREVCSVEIDPALAETARANLAADGVVNVNVVVGDGLAGLPEHAPYDCIVISGGVAEIPAALLAQLKIGGRLLAFVGAPPAMSLRRIERIAEDAFATTDLLETVVPMLQGGAAPPRFAF